MIAVHVRMDRVDDLGPEVAHLLLDDAIDVDVRERVESHVGQVEVNVVGHAQFRRCGTGLLLLLRANHGVIGVLRGASVGDADDAHDVPAYSRVERNRAAHPEDLVVRVRSEDENPAHPSTVPSASAPFVSNSSSRSPPSPHATTGPSGRSATTVPARS